MNFSARLPHALLGVESRVVKAQKIERLLKLSKRHQPIRLLDVGTGGGGVAVYFSNHPVLSFDVSAVDVVDQRQVKDGYHFELVEGVKLPFSDCSFDVVISNHAIEHVGDQAEQRGHLMEMRRVMKPDGVAYLAVPNRWSIVEPHYSLAFLSWFPRFLRSSYLKFRKRGEFYDCEPLSVSDLESLFASCGFSRYQHLHLDSIHEFINIEGASGVLRVISWIPDPLLMLGRRLNPTLIYALSK